MAGVSRRKQLVKVLASHDIDGSIQPKRIILADGRSFEVDESKDPYSAKNKPTGKPRKYPVKIGDRETLLYEDGGLFWVLMKEGR